MPVLTQLNLNIGTEQNPNMVLHDLHDIRISSTDVTTVTRLLGCDAGVNSIAPLTLANAASLLGVQTVIRTINGFSSTADIRTYTDVGLYNIAGMHLTSNPPISGVGNAAMIVLGHDPNGRQRLLYTDNRIFLSIGDGEWVEK